ncbi:MAG TPA: hypothetical protein VIS72_03465 [Anaerolineales bacterium]
MKTQTNESNFLRSDMSLLEQIIDFQFNSRERLSQGTGDGQIGIESCESRPEDGTMQACKE